MKQQIGIWSKSCRDWQEEAYRLAMDTFDRGEKDFLCVATPGGGKTVFALRVAHKLLQFQQVNRVVVIAPTDHLRKQWALSAGYLGIDLDPYSITENPRDFWGAVLTYQSLAANDGQVKQDCDSAPTLVIIDEIHHAGDSLTWGKSLQTAFESAVCRLSLSGTPFRSDRNPIPFVKYENLQSRSDYNYSYRQAISENVCRPIHFKSYDGKMKWKSGGITYAHSFCDEVKEKVNSERLITALNPSGSLMKQMITDANNQLDEIRLTNHRRAAGLVLAVDQSHAKRLATLISQITGEFVDVAVSEDKNASDKIEIFSNSDRKWLVCVKMVSEGVDIPRLRVGVYATNVKSDLFFRQAVGRFVRVIPNLKEQDAYLYIPKDYEIVKIAQEIERERSHGLKEKSAKKTLLGEPDRDEKDYEAISAEFTGTQQLSLFGNMVATAFNLPGNIARQIEEQKATKPQNDEEIIGFKKKEMLRDEVIELSKDVARKLCKNKEQIDWNLPHKLWIDRGGKNIETESYDELEKRKHWLKLKLRG